MNFSSLQGSILKWKVVVVGESSPKSKLKQKESWMNDLEIKVLLGEKIFPSRKNSQVGISIIASFTIFIC